MSVKSRTKNREAKKYKGIFSWTDIRKNWIVYLFCVSLFGWVAYNHQKYSVLEDDYQTARAIVYDRQGRGRYTYSCYYFYVSDIQYKSSTLHNYIRYNIGDTIDVRYYPANPSINRPEEEFHHWHW